MTSTNDAPRGYDHGVTVFVHDGGTSSTGKEYRTNHYAVILTPAELIARRGTASVVYLSSSTKKLSLAGTEPFYVPVLDHDGRDAVALADQVHTVDISRLGRPCQQLGDNVMAAIEREVNYALGLTPQLL